MVTKGNTLYTHDDKILCSNCLEVCGHVDRTASEVTGVFTKFRLLVDLPIETVRICERKRPLEASHRHHYANRVLTLSPIDFAKANLFETVNQPKIYSKSFSAPFHQTPCRVVSPCLNFVLANLSKTTTQNCFQDPTSSDSDVDSNHDTTQVITHKNPNDSIITLNIVPQLNVNRSEPQPSTSGTQQLICDSKDDRSVNSDDDCCIIHTNEPSTTSHTKTTVVDEVNKLNKNHYLMRSKYSPNFRRVSYWEGPEEKKRRMKRTLPKNTSPKNTSPKNPLDDHEILSVHSSEGTLSDNESSINNDHSYNATKPAVATVIDNNIHRISTIDQTIEMVVTNVIDVDPSTEPISSSSSKSSVSVHGTSNIIPNSDVLTDLSADMTNTETALDDYLDSVNIDIPIECDQSINDLENMLITSSIDLNEINQMITANFPNLFETFSDDYSLDFDQLSRNTQ